MALRRVRPKIPPHFESIVSDEWIEAFPDDWDVIEGTPDDTSTPVPTPDPAPAPAGPPRGRGDGFFDEQPPPTFR